MSPSNKGWDSKQSRLVAREYLRKARERRRATKEDKTNEKMTLNIVHRFREHFTHQLTLSRTRSTDAPFPPIIRSMGAGWFDPFGSMKVQDHLPDLEPLLRSNFGQSSLTRSAPQPNWLLSTLKANEDVNPYAVRDFYVYIDTIYLIVALILNTSSIESSTDLFDLLLIAATKGHIKISGSTLAGSGPAQMSEMERYEARQYIIGQLFEAFFSTYLGREDVEGDKTMAKRIQLHVKQAISRFWAILSEASMLSAFLSGAALSSETFGESLNPMSHNTKEIVQPSKFPASPKLEKLSDKMSWLGEQHLQSSSDIEIPITQLRKAPSFSSESNPSAQSSTNQSVTPDPCGTNLPVATLSTEADIISTLLESRLDGPRSGTSIDGISIDNSLQGNSTQHINLNGRLSPFMFELQKTLAALQPQPGLKGISYDGESWDGSDTNQTHSTSRESRRISGETHKLPVAYVPASGDSTNLSNDARSERASTGATEPTMRSERHSHVKNRRKPSNTQDRSHGDSDDGSSSSGNDCSRPKKQSPQGGRRKLKDKFAGPFYKHDQVSFAACQGVCIEIDPLYRHHIKVKHYEKRHHISTMMLSRLDALKANRRTQSERWVAIYRTLFNIDPAQPIPDPFWQPSASSTNLDDLIRGVLQLANADGLTSSSETSGSSDGSHSSCAFNSSLSWRVSEYRKAEMILCEERWRRVLEGVSSMQQASSLSPPTQSQLDELFTQDQTCGLPDFFNQSDFEKIQFIEGSWDACGLDVTSIPLWNNQHSLPDITTTGCEGLGVGKGKERATDIAWGQYNLPDLVYDEQLA